MTIDEYTLIADLFGKRRSEKRPSSSNTSTIMGVATSNSANGSVMVRINGDLTGGEDGELVIPTDAHIVAGDIVSISLVGGTAKAPRVTGTVGGGDRIYASLVETNQLVATKADITDLTAAEGRIGTLEANALTASSAVITDLQADTAKVHDLTTAELSAATAYIGTLEAGNLTASNLLLETAKVENVEASEIEAAVGYIGDLTTGNVTAANIVADHGTVGSLSSNYAQVNMANVSNAWIENGVVKDGAITNAMINSVSANKLTAGTIDASNITVTNLNASNITAGTLNGQRIGQGSLSLDKLSEDVYTETEVDAIVEGLNDRIDGAIETHTGTVVPTLNNSPASAWNTTDLKDEHVGDVYYVVNSQSQQNGYCYRFTKSGSSYSWQLIKDSDVTAALSRLETAEGKITTFDSDISTLKTDTGTLKTKTQSLETSLGDKVDTSTFNELSSTVDENSSSITSMSTVLTNNGLTSSTNITNTVNTVSQTATGNSSKITQLISTLGTNADGTTKEGDIVHRTSAVEQDLSGFKTTVSNTYATKTSVEAAQADATNALNRQVAYSATCSTAAGTAAKVATCTNFPTLAAGATVTVRFSTANTSTGAITLNVNSTGAKTVYVNGAATSSSNQLLWAANANVTFTYDGTYWRVVSEPRTWYGTCATAAGTAAKAATINEIVVCKGTVVKLNMTYENTSTSATMNLTSTGAKALYYGTTTTRPTTANGYGWGAASTATFVFDGQYWRVGDTSVLSRLIQAETTISSHTTSINQNAEAITAKANATDVYTKQETNGLISTEVTNRNAAITAKANEITASVEETYATKTALSDGVADAKGYTDSEVSSAKAEIKVTTDNISTEVSKKVGNSEIISKINQSAETVKIQASKVEIDGTAVFSAIKSQADAAYVSEKSITTATDFNTLTDSGVYYIKNGSCANAPVTNWGKLDVSVSGKVVQWFYPDALPYAYYRAKTSSTWSAWQKVDGVGAADNAYNKAQSRGEQLITNGSGTLGNNTNFTAWTYDPTVSMNGSAGSFTIQKEKAYKQLAIDEFFPVSTSEQYILSFDMKAETTDSVRPIVYSYVDLYDIDKRQIVYDNVHYPNGTMTTLAQDLKSGDTVVYLANIDSSFVYASNANGLTFWNYTNSKGYTYPPGTYSRNVYRPLFSSQSQIDTTNNKITLNSAWTGPTYPAGTPVSQAQSGGTYVYVAATPVNVPDEPTHYEGTIGPGYHPGNENEGLPRKFREATAYARIGFLWNYQAKSNAQIWLANLSFGIYNATHDEVSAAQATADAAAPKASAVKRTQRIWYRSNSATAPSTPGTASSNWVTKADDGNAAWTKMHVAISSTHKYVYTCEQYELASGTVGYTTVLRDNTITVIDGGNIITGTVSANAINATSGTFDSANIPALTADHIKANVINAVNNGTGTINADKINVSGITIGQSQVTNLATDLAAKASTASVTAEANARKAIYGTCSTAAGTAAKAVTCANFEYYTGARIAVKFTTANTAAAPTLNVNSTTAKAVWNNNAVASASNPVLWGANATLTFVYDGTQWVLEDKAPTYSVACSTAASTQAKAPAVTGALVVNGTTLNVNFSTANTYASGAVQLNLSSTGAANVYKNNAVTSTTNKLLWAANTTLTFTRVGQYWYVADSGLNKYVQHVDDNGIQVHPAASTADYALINANGMDVVKGNTSVAQFGSTARIGTEAGQNIKIDSDSIDICDGSTVKAYVDANGMTVNGKMSFRTVLYENTSGYNGTITLSDSAANYNHMRIHTKTNYGHGSVDVPNPNGKDILLLSMATDNSGITTMYFIQQSRYISGTSFSVNHSGYAWMVSRSASATNTSVNAENYMYVTRVEAWNE